MSTLETKTEKSQFDAHKTDKTAHADLFEAKEDKNKKGVAGGYAPLNISTKLASQYLDLNLSLPIGAKICDFQESNFVSNKLLQVVNCLVKINGVIDPSTTNATFPNISPFSVKSYFTNNIGLKNSFNEPYGLKTTNLSTYVLTMRTQLLVMCN